MSRYTVKSQGEWRGGGGGGLYVDDQRIFLGLKFMIPGFFWVGKFGKYFFLCVCGLI